MNSQIFCRSQSGHNGTLQAGRIGQTERIALILGLEVYRGKLGQIKGKLGSGGGTRTPDTRIMIPLL